MESGLEKYVYEYPLFPVVLSEAHNLDVEDALLRFRRRVADLDTWLADLDEALADPAGRRRPRERGHRRAD